MGTAVSYIERVEVREKQSGKCALTGKALPDDPSLYDVISLNGSGAVATLVQSDLQAVLPIEHLKSLGAWRDRDAEMAEIKDLLDIRNQLMKSNVEQNNRLKAFERRTDAPRAEIVEHYQAQADMDAAKLKEYDRALGYAVNHFAEVDALTSAALTVPSIGPVTVGYCRAYLDLANIRYVGQLWSYAGIAKPSHERYTKGAAGGGSKSLRCALWNMANSQVKANGPYRIAYDQMKHRLENSEKTVMTRAKGGKMVEKAWKDVSKGHRHGAALRKIMKMFLSDWYCTGRQLMGLPIVPLYADEVLGHEDHLITPPTKRGWPVISGHE